MSEEIYRNCEIVIEPDTDDTVTPREWGTNIGTMLCWHNRMVIGGDEDDNVTCPATTNHIRGWGGDYQVFNEIEDFEDFFTENGFIYLPIFIYDHSGITLNTTGFACPWDSGQVGFIYTTRERAFETSGAYMSDEEIQEQLNQEVEDYDKFVRGDMWAFYINGMEWGVVPDSIGGYDNYEECLSDAKGMVDQYYEELKWRKDRDE